MYKVGGGSRPSELREGGGGRGESGFNLLGLPVLLPAVISFFFTLRKWELYCKLTC